MATVRDGAGLTSMNDLVDALSGSIQARLLAGAGDRVSEPATGIVALTWAICAARQAGWNLPPPRLCTRAVHERKVGAM